MAILPICDQCGSVYPSGGAPFICACGGVFDFKDFPEYSPERIDHSQKGLWKYHSMSGLEATAELITLGEGNTPLEAAEYQDVQIYLKLEDRNPTGSYKDRGSAVLTSFLVSRGIRSVVEDSSGNAGASLAAYAARAGIRAKIFVPESASGPKRKQIEQFGADLIPVPGPRSMAAEVVRENVSVEVAYASHAFMPFGLNGIATISYEIFEQLGGTAPGTIVAPVGHGGLLYGMMRGFRALRMASVANNEPFYAGVQSSGCAPIFDAFQKHEYTLREPHESDTIAEGVRVKYPVRGKAILRELAGKRGQIYQVDEKTLLCAYEDLIKKGFFIEPTSALPWAILKQNIQKFPEPIVLVLSGSGYKTEHKS